MPVPVSLTRALRIGQCASRDVDGYSKVEIHVTVLKRQFAAIGMASSGVTANS